MYTLTEKQFKALNEFVSKLPESIVRSKFEKLLAEIEPAKRLSTEQCEAIVSLSGELPIELQNFPQGFVLAVKNGEEEDDKVKEEALKDVSKSIAKEKVVSAEPFNQEPEVQEEIVEKKEKVAKKEVAKPVAKAKKK